MTQDSPPTAKTDKRGTLRPLASRSEKVAWRDLVIASIPPHKTYVEAFAGSASLFFAQAKRSDHEVLIDSDAELIALYKFLQEGSDEDFAWLRDQSWTWDPAQFTKLRKSQPKHPREIAFKLKYLDAYSKAGRRVEICTSEKARSSKAADFLTNLEDLRSRFDGVEIVHGDALELLTKFDGDDTFIYLDAPSGCDVDKLRKSTDALTAKVLISVDGEADFGDQWSTIELDRERAAKRQTLLINFSPGAVTKFYDDCEYDLYYNGGAHWHMVEREKRSTEFDGSHSHLFVIGGLAVSTNWGGEHLHVLDEPTASHASDYLSEHTHSLDRPEAETELGGGHGHELDVTSTIYGGIHQHDVVMRGETYRSLSPGEFWGLFSAREKRSQPVKVDKLVYPEVSTTRGGFFERRVGGSVDLLFVTKAGDQPIIWSIATTRSGVDLPFTTPLGDRARKSIVDQPVRATEVTELDREGITQIDSCNVEFGVWTKTHREVFVSDAKFFSGSLVFERDLGGWTARLSKSAQPLVMRLGPGAAPADRPLLPASLAKSVPAPLRFWAGGSLDAFMRSSLFDNVRVAGGGLVRCKSVIVPSPEPITADLDTIKALISWASGSEPVIVDASMAKSCKVIDLVGRLAKSVKPFLVQWPASMQAASELIKLGPVFEVGSDPRFMFVASAPVPRHEDLRPVACDDRVSSLVKRATDRGLEIIKATDSEEERFVLGIALEPLESGEPDLQNDFYNKAEIRLAAHGFMENHANVGFMHRAVINDKAAILESYLSPVEFSVTRPDGTEKVVREGTWLIGFGIRDDDIWAGIKSGDLRGPSIGGFADRVPTEGAA